MLYLKTVLLKVSQNSQENTSATGLQLKKETLVQVFSCEFCEIFKNTIFTEHIRMTAFVW